MKHSILIIQKPVMLSVIVFLLVSLTACSNLELDSPKHLIKGETLFTDSHAVQAAMVGIYANLRENTILTGGHQGLSALLGTYADELDYYSPFGLPEEQFYKNTLSPSDPVIAEIWNNAYNQIYAANAIIEGVKDSPYFTQEEQTAFTGEALFIRAIIHFYLVNLYGDIPYITTTDYRINKTVSRQPETTVYEVISTDLLQAVDDLPEIDSSGAHLRPTKYTAMALLARVYAYTQQWQLATQYATQVINNNSWEPAIENVFLKNSSSTLWQFSSGASRSNTLEAQTFIVLAAPPNTMALNNSLAASFEEADLRKEHWLGTVTDGTTTWYFPYKYKQRTGSGTAVEYSIVMRMAEQYLIRAEANTHLGNFEQARADIDKIRERAGLASTSAISQSQLKAAILQERRVELFTEHGHRFFDLKRNQQLDPVLTPVKPGWEPHDKLLPLPEKELLVNPNLQPQNPGY
ncbi:MAG: RagB/SusD family nutrient uptake outer membrane protein [Flavobacteriaceae bacterium]|nr:RagB/SusD family nutrient uptake outer membrane protein [Flavobacteriaceae bacterium]|tara:strand:- start:904 stop:2292 length:1389 start_codon:yes stop_codon:yes gene_type:complete